MKKNEYATMFMMIVLMSFLFLYQHCYKEQDPNSTVYKIQMRKINETNKRI